MLTFCVGQCSSEIFHKGVCSNAGTRTGLPHRIISSHAYRVRCTCGVVTTPRALRGFSVVFPLHAVHLVYQQRHVADGGCAYSWYQWSVFSVGKMSRTRYHHCWSHSARSGARDVCRCVEQFSRCTTSTPLILFVSNGVDLSGACFAFCTAANTASCFYFL